MRLHKLGLKIVGARTVTASTSALVEDSSGSCGLKNQRKSGSARHERTCLLVAKADSLPSDINVYSQRLVMHSSQRP